MIPLKI